jgi:hypothetical protein
VVGGLLSSFLPKKSEWEIDTYLDKDGTTFIHSTPCFPLTNYQGRTPFSSPLWSSNTEKLQVPAKAISNNGI